MYVRIPFSILKYLQSIKMDQKQKNILYIVLGVLAFLCCLSSSSLGGYFAFRGSSTTNTGTGSIPPPPPINTWQDNLSSWMDALGGDIRSTNGSIEQCKTTCLADPNCKSFCRSNTLGTCYLRDSRAGALRPDPGFSCHIKS